MDDITELIIGVLATTKGGWLRKAVANQGATAAARSFRAFECFVRGMIELNKYTEKSVSLALLKEAVRLNHGYANPDHPEVCDDRSGQIFFFGKAARQSDQDV